MKSLLKFSEKSQPAEQLNFHQTRAIKGGDDKRPLVGGGTLPPPPPPVNGDKFK